MEIIKKASRMIYKVNGEQSVSLLECIHLSLIRFSVLMPIIQAKLCG